MTDLVTHLALFAFVAVAIVTLGVFYGDADDERARQVWPKRMLSFVIGCTVLVALMLICEHTFAALG